MAIYAQNFLLPPDAALRQAIDAIVGPIPVKISPQGDTLMVEQRGTWAPFFQGKTPRDCLNEVTQADRVDQLVRAHLFQHHQEEAKKQNFASVRDATTFQNCRIQSLQASCRLHEVWGQPYSFFEKLWIAFLSALEQVWFSLGSYFLSSDGTR
jgi:hypothetical protein